jgi:1-acyl-sn-glycerol-3-phosphate acyltransferase
MKAVKTCVRVAKEGGTIAIAPEGNRTYSGVTESIKPSITGLIRLLRIPVAIFRIEGGYGVHPR